MSVETTAPFRRVVGTLIRGVADGLLGGAQGIPLAGAQVTATASVKSAASGEFIVLDPVDGTTDQNARLRNATTGEDGILLLVTDDPSLGVIGWTWHITVTAPSLQRPGQPPRSVEFDIDVPSGEGDLDLATLVPVPGNVGEDVILWRAAVDQTAANLAASEAIVATSVDDARLQGDNLELLRRDGTVIDVGNVRGNDGASAYQLWLDAGNTGTIEEWREDQKGRDGSNVLPTDVAIAESLNAPGPAKDALNSNIGARVTDVWATTARYPTLDPTGVSNSRDAIQQAIRDTPTGATLHLPGGKYFVGGAASIMNRAPDNSLRSISMDWSGAEIVSDSTQAPFTFTASTPVQHAVSAVSVINVTMENGLAIPCTSLTVADTSIAVGLKRGDIVKVIANNVIPGSEPGSGGNQPRVGEYLPFHSVSGSAIILVGTLVDQFTDTVRLCKMDESISVYMKCGTLSFSDAIMSSKSPRNAVILRNLVNAKVEQLTMRNSTGAMISNEGCYKTTIVDASLNYGIDNPDNSNFSYGVADKASAFTRVLNAHGRNLRHLYTDDTSAIPANSPNTHLYGCTTFAKVANSSGQGSSAAVFDTHHASYGAEFINCTARDSYFGFQLRGRAGRWVNPRASNCTVGGRIFNQSQGGETYDSNIVNWESDNCRTDLEVSIHPTGHPQADVRQDSWFTIDGFTTRGTKYRGVSVRNGSVRIANYSFTPAATMENGGGSIALRNSRLALSGSIEHDFSANTGGASLSVIDLYAFGFSIFESERGKYRHPVAGAERVVAYIASGGGDLVRCMDQRMTQAPAVIISAAPLSGSYVDWFAENNTRSSAGVLLGTNSMAVAENLAPLGRSMKADLAAFVDPTGGSNSIAGFPAPQFDGQRLAVVHYGSSNTVSISHDTSAGGRRALIGNTGKSLSAGQSILLLAVPGGVWKQVSPVA